jgi:hypothetical protein
MKTCRPKFEVDYIIYVITNWEKGTEVNKMAPGLDKDRLVNFRRQHCSGNKYIHQYFTEEIWAPGDAEPRTILRKYNKDGTHGHIVVSREELFDAIMTCIPTMDTKVRRGLGSIAETSMPTSPRTMSSSFAPLASHA